ncbi:30S ribosomal protein S18 [Dehalogenimonas sp. THU2]|uniref:30S ribosomal protein S18 n=1 Tax=Dehalogenimonas sp. THU2 TaxID=3151121 RepID=UPI003218C180
MVVARSFGARPQGARPAGRFGGRGRFQARRKVCAFCADRNIVIDYKDTARLSRFISERGKINPRRRSGTCARHQRALATAIKQARTIALLPFVPEHIRQAGTFWTMSPAAPKAPESVAEAKAATVPVESKIEAAPEVVAESVADTVETAPQS